MPNYEELYNIARNKYNQAVENRNTIRRNSSELQTRKTTLTRELEEKTSALTAVQQKIALVQNALDKAKSILQNEFLSMRKDLQATSDEYKKIISSGNGVADLSLVYADDITNTQNNLNTIISELERLYRTLESEESQMKKAVTDCSTELSSVTSQLRNVGSESAAQRQINNYYTEMKEYETKWMNGE